MRLLFLERDIDKALEEEKNLTETVNDILWKGLKDYLKQTGTNSTYDENLWDIFVE
jgi:hypothetical protein